MIISNWILPCEYYSLMLGYRFGLHIHRLIRLRSTSTEYTTKRYFVNYLRHSLLMVANESNPRAMQNHFLSWKLRIVWAVILALKRPYSLIKSKSLRGSSSATPSYLRIPSMYAFGLRTVGDGQTVYRNTLTTSLIADSAVLTKLLNRAIAWSDFSFTRVTLFSSAEGSFWFWITRL